MLSPKRTTVVILFVILVVIASLVRAQEAGQGDLRQRKILFDSERDGNSEIYVMDPDGSNQQRLTHTPGKGRQSRFPFWSPDGQKIAFASDQDGNMEIYVVDRDGFGVRRLTRTAGKESGNPAWSPDGKRIAFERGFESDLDGKWRFASWMPTAPA